MKRLLIVLLLISFPAAAEDYTLTLTQAEVQQIGAALADHPFKDVAALISKLQAQVNAQTAKEPSPTTN